MNNYMHLADLAFDILDSAEVLHEFDDIGLVTLSVSREAWLEYIKQGEAWDEHMDQEGE